MSTSAAPDNAAGSASLGIPSARFLASVREALGRPDEPPARPHPPLADDLDAIESAARRVRADVAAQLPGLLDRMAETAALRGWNVARCPGVEDALDHVVSLIRQASATSVARSVQPVFETLPIDSAVARAGALCWPAVYEDATTEARLALRRRLADSGMGITGADYAIAETGSVIVLPRRGLSRLVSVVPPVHVAIVRPQDIIGTLDDLFALRRQEFHRSGSQGAADMGSYLNFISGPSRTADIEQTIVVGVHGPREVHLILMEQE